MKLSYETRKPSHINTLTINSTIAVVTGVFVLFAGNASSSPEQEKLALSNAANEQSEIYKHCVETYTTDPILFHCISSKNLRLAYEHELEIIKLQDRVQQLQQQLDLATQGI